MVKLIESQEARKYVKGKEYVFIDVRSPAEFKASHIKGSYNVPLENVDEYKQQLEKIRKHIIIICRTGRRASMACNSINNIHKKNIYVLDGGITSWSQHKFPLEVGKSVWDIERQVRAIAGALVLLGVLLGFTFSHLWFILSGAVGFGLLFAALTNSCMMGMVLAKLPYNKVGNFRDDLESLFESR